MLDMTTKREGRTMRATAAPERAVDTALNAGMAWWDLMLRMQRASLASFSVYSPASETRISATVPQAGATGTQVIPVGEERLNVATRTELGETTRIRRRVIARPVEQEVTLREERVVVERRPAPPREGAAQGEVLTETVIEMSDSRQVPQVWKSIHVAEEVVLRREVTERKERVREMLRRDVVEVEHDGEGREVEPRDAGHHDAEDRAGRATAPTAAQSDAARERTGAQARAERERLEAQAEAARERVAAQAEAARERTEALAEAARRATSAAAEQPKPAAAQQAEEARDRAAQQPGGPRKG